MIDSDTLDLRALRKARGLTQMAVAKALGVSLPTVTKWERMRVGLSPERLAQLAKLYGLPREGAFAPDAQIKAARPVPQKNIVWSPEREAAAVEFGELMRALGREHEIQCDGRRSRSREVAVALKIAIEALKSGACSRTKRDATPPLRALRDRAGLTQAEAARRMGVERGTWANDEKNAAPSPEKIAKAREAFGLNSGEECAT